MIDQQVKNSFSLHKLIPLIVLSILTVVLSTLCVQITMLHFSPNVRAIQCYFNNKILDHTSVDIYQGSDVLYWRTAQYDSLQQIYGFSYRFSQTISNMAVESFVSINQTLIDTIEIQLSAQYDFKQKGVSQFKYNESLANIQQLIDRTMFNRSFYQYLDEVKIHVVIPIVDEEYDYIELDIQADFYSNLQMFVTIQADPKIFTLYEDDYPQSKLNDFGQPLPTIHKITRFNRLTLKNQWIRWVVVFINLVIAVYVFVTLAYDQRKIMLVLNNQKITFTQNIQQLGLPRIIFQIVTIFAIICHFLGDGYVCLFCWLRLTVFLSFTENPFMLGFLMKRAIPTYAKLMFNLLIILTAFVFLSMVIFGFSKKFESVKLSYFEYLFNFFQYGIYENFEAIKEYGIIANIFYLIHMIVAVCIGNQILQSILASQLLKNSYLNSLKEFIENVNCKCPNCFAPAQVRKKVKINLKEKSRFISQFLQEHFTNKISNYQYQINITSPKLTPYFNPQKTKIKKRKRSVDSLLQESILSNKSIKEEEQKSPKSGKLLFEIGGDEASQLSKYDQFLKKIKAHKISLFQCTNNLKVKRKQQSSQKDLVKRKVLIQAVKKISKLISIL